MVCPAGASAKGRPGAEGKAEGDEAEGAQPVAQARPALWPWEPPSAPGCPALGRTLVCPGHCPLGREASSPTSSTPPPKGPRQRSRCQANR